MMTLSPAATRPAPVVALELTEPLPGFPSHRDYALVAADPEGRLSWLQSLDPEGPRFLVVPPAVFFPDYSPVLPGTVCAELGLPDPGDALLYCLLTVPRGDVGAATANLRAPVVVNPLARLARQVVLADGAHPIRRPLRR
jgi:flagellar assembly factor FliW